MTHSQTGRISHDPSHYRHWLEQPTLVVTFALLFALPLVLGRLIEVVQAIMALEDSFQRTFLTVLFLVIFFLLVVAGIVAIIAMTLWSARRRLNRLREGAVCAGPEQLPELFEMAQSVRDTLGVDTPVAVYVLDGRWLPRAIAPVSVLGVTKPYAVVIDTAMLYEMGPEELRFLLGVEYGHVRLGHVRVLTMIDAVSGSLGRVPFVGGFVRALFSGWTSLAIYSADRAGLVACGRLASAYEALGKLAVGRRCWSEVNHAALARQAVRPRWRVFDIAHRMSAPFDTQPMGRFQHLVDFADQPAFRLLCPDADVTIPAAELWRQVASGTAATRPND